MTNNAAARASTELGEGGGAAGDDAIPRAITSANCLAEDPPVGAQKWLGNVQQSTDDQHAFYDRSLGDTTRGTPSAGPNRLLTASNRRLAPTSPVKGDLEVGYDPAGNVNDLVHRSRSSLADNV